MTCNTKYGVQRTHGQLADSADGAQMTRKQCGRRADGEQTMSGR